ncbi:MAG: hypothetical protein PHS44_03435 [Candidatus Dojkabacteria bacterium]|jgi:hypothetical protein|nr:hypothetical protein [Candidatus Dojkabacteria bacterium]
MEKNGPTTSGKTKNDWGDLFRDISSKMLVVKDKAGKVIFELDLVITFIVAILIPALALIFVILVATDNWNFETRMKEK